jgi:uncharacterized membrane protein
VTSSEFALVLRWTLSLWTLGWLVLPFSARLFPFLPDKGLAAGRILALVLGSLFCFWGASLHLVPLTVAPWLLIGGPLLAALGWKNAAFRAQISPSRRSLFISDVVFLLGFGAFLWVRLRHPSANDLEKPMDMALISAAMRANWLPFENPWFAGQSFTNYYYFGPLMGALTARTLATPPHLAYNMVQPIFCATFLSVTWSLCSALSKSAKVGLVAMLLVCLGGHLEPLRQIAKTHQLWPLDWWTTSRVIENTINEYPAFTMLIGDLHAHFYAFSLAAAFFCVCYGLLKAQSQRLRSALLLLGGLMLGVFVLTNTWDTPFYGLLWLVCARFSRQNSQWSRGNVVSAVGAVLLVPVSALPYLLKFKSQVSGIVFNPWIPDPFSFLLLWGGWLVLGLVILTLEPGEEQVSSEATFRRTLIGFGLLALLFPFVFYIRGVFGDGDFRHQDTVFKFGLQAWLLLGIGLASEAGFRVRAWMVRRTWPTLTATAAFMAVVALAPVAVTWTRTTRDAPRDTLGKIPLSLNAASYLPSTDQEAIEWLRLNAKPGEKVIEAVKFESGNFGGDYDPNFGRVSAFSGVTAVVGWPQHVVGWGADWGEVTRRGALVQAVPSSPGAIEELRQMGATYLFSGVYEPKLAPSSHLKQVWSSASGETQILRLMP